MRASYPPQMLEETQRLVEWMNKLSTQYKEKLVLHFIDPQSFLGFVKSIRYWARRYPTFILNGRKVLVGWDQESLEKSMQQELTVANQIGEIR